MDSLKIRKARIEDAWGIMQIYQEVYAGTYPDALMNHLPTLRDALASSSFHWMIALDGELIVGSVVYLLDLSNQMAKAYGAVVREEYRGHNLTAKMMTLGYSQIRSLERPIEVVYATTRTVTAAPQKLTALLGYRKIGIFPNVHKTKNYETHALTARFDPDALAKRHVDFKLHPVIAPLFAIAARECGLPPLPVLPRVSSEQEVPAEENESVVEVALEIIQAPQFVCQRFKGKKVNIEEHHWFYPFHEPNLLLTSADQSIEVFSFLSSADQHCALIGIRDVYGVGYEAILKETCEILRNRGVRYIEFIVRADEADKIQIALNCQFIPCGYFPAMKLSEGKRYDFVTFSRSFEILDFRGLDLQGVNLQWLNQYYRIWRSIALDPILSLE